MAIYSYPILDDRGYRSDDPFGATDGRLNPHLGSDWSVPYGTSIYAMSAGQVVVNTWSSVLGNLVGVAHDDGMFANYAHMAAPSPLGVGARVELLDYIGQVGSTGSASTGPHLHCSLGSTSGAIFGVGFGSTLVDPHAWIEAHMASAAGGRAQQISLPKRKRTFMLLYGIKDDLGTNWLLVFNGKARVFNGGGIDDNEVNAIREQFGLSIINTGTRHLFNAIMRFYGGEVAK